jgi:hypothetical protein
MVSRGTAAVTAHTVGETAVAEVDLCPIRGIVTA